MDINKHKDRSYNLCFPRPALQEATDRSMTPGPGVHGPSCRARWRQHNAFIRRVRYSSYNSNGMVWCMSTTSRASSDYSKSFNSVETEPLFSLGFEEIF
jgi:hypothetical protein